ncbi:UNVERIFIED_CONTAM: DCN1-like protein 1 [Siphonaria sp. JEL0065]|nr:DCN1-like protein 1 [Siphonaria sp. JEL0065]
MSNKEKIGQFTAFTGADDKTASEYLTNSGWRVEQACDAYFQNQSENPTPAKASTTAAAPAAGSKKNVDKSKLSKLFDTYKDADDDIIGVEGTERLCEDLEVDPTDVVTLVLAFHLKCENMCEFSRAGWNEGWAKLNCESLDDMKRAVSHMRSDLDDTQKFREIYLFTFNFAKAENQKSLDKSTAIAFWQLLFTGKYKHIDAWLEFLEDHKNAISKDTWVQFLDFSKKYPDGFDGYEDDGAWPVLIDEFVEFVQDQ